MTTTLAYSYVSLLEQFPLHPIRSRAEYKHASAVLDKLVMRDEDTLDDGERDYLETLELLIENYDDQNLRWGMDRRPPSQRLRYLLDQSGLTPSDLAKLLSVSQPLVSLILGGKRELSKSNVRKLADHFHLDAGYFL